jgi:AMP-polyphosphate phosphotransferase
MLSTVNLSLSMEREQYKMLLKKYQNALSLLVYQIYLQQRPVAIIMEGWDTAGKSGAIRRITEKIDPRRYMVYAIQSPSEVEASYHYLYRFWSRVPRKGQIAIFDHSWYDRILNERVNGNCTEEEWKRAFLEINSFERQLVDFGTILFKFWLHIEKDEQIRRFTNRIEIEEQALQISGLDWNDNERWDLFSEAVNDMLLKTSPVNATWTVIESNSKLYSRIKILQTLVSTLSQELHYDPNLIAELENEKRSKKKKKN